VAEAVAAYLLAVLEEHMLATVAALVAQATMQVQAGKAVVVEAPVAIRVTAVMQDLM
jgi:hypothetical protein